MELHSQPKPDAVEIREDFVVLASKREYPSEFVSQKVGRVVFLGCR